MKKKYQEVKSRSNRRGLSKDSWCSNEGQRGSRLQAVVGVFKLRLTQVEAGIGNAAKRNGEREQGHSFPGSTDSLVHLLRETLGTQR